MFEKTVYGLSFEEFIRYALSEDMGNGDHTSLSTIHENKTGKALVKIKEDGIVSGLEVAANILEVVDKSLKHERIITDGQAVKKGDIAMHVEGNIRSMLGAERLLLNCMQRMSGIATLTRKFAEAVSGTRCKILDTRKTTPNFRQFEKKAVVDGGGFNHRHGLYDMILIKDNHVDAAGGVAAALLKAAEYQERIQIKLPVEIETRNMDEINEVLKTGIADRIMMDNFQPEELMEAVKIIGQRFETEASGGITLDNVRSYALTGVQFISVGALTHSYKSLDISMKISR
jgi:nicotinate-nucleotide pyrophosphorylase (carboxylating)